MNIYSVPKAIKAGKFVTIEDGKVIEYEYKQNESHNYHTHFVSSTLNAGDKATINSPFNSDIVKYAS